ncbi:hypothetical protein DFS33DRAFT_1385141 [Desarmillaria ectypa]|nr:hypothetical protein DFS33DRAFT_1385141 [Desarmillaria ectypa]
MNGVSETSLSMLDAVAPTIDKVADPMQASRDTTPGPGTDTGSEDQQDVEAILVDSQDTEMGVFADVRPTVGGKTCYAVAFENDNPDSPDEASLRSRATVPPFDSRPSVGGKTYYMVPLRRESESTILSEGLAEPPERASVGGKTWIPSMPPASSENQHVQTNGTDSERPTLGREKRMPSMPSPASGAPARPSLGGKTWKSSIPTMLSGEEVLTPEVSMLPEKVSSGSENVNITMEDVIEEDDDEESVLSDGGEFREEFEAAMGGDFAFKGSYTYNGPYPQAPNPCLTIEGIGPIGLPLSPRDAWFIIDCASQAPYGHNEQTIVNTEVRDTWEIDQGSIKFENPVWDTFVKQTVAKNTKVIWEMTVNPGSLTVLMLMHEDDAPRIAFSAAGGINYGLQRLKNFASETPTSDDLKIANLVITRLSVQNKQSAISMSEFAIRWKVLEMWKRIMKATEFDLSTYGLDRIIVAWRTLEEMVAKISKLKMAHDFLKGISEAATDSELIIREWSRMQLSQALLTLTTPNSEDVPILISVIKEKGTAWFSETIMPRLAKNPSLYSFWISDLGALLAQCLDNVLNLWESVVAAPALRPYYYSGPPLVASQQLTVTRIIRLVDLCISTNHTETCKTLFVTILKRKPPNRVNFQALYTPLIPEFRQLLQKKKVDICTPPFADIMQYWEPNPAPLTCDGCAAVVLNAACSIRSSKTSPLRLLCGFFKRREIILRDTFEVLVTYEIVRMGRAQGLLVRKRPDALASLQWSTQQANARTFLSMIGDDNVISKLVGRRYADVLRALEGTKQFTLPIHPAPGPSSIDVDAPPQDASTSLPSFSSSVVAGTKRKQPRKSMAITGPVIDLTED